MVDQEAVREKVDALEELAMGYGTAVFELFAEDYLTEFYDLFRIRDRSPKLIPFEVSFREALRLSCGEGRFEAVAETAERLFGLPKRIMTFSEPDQKALTERLGGRRGRAPFFFVFDLLFCEYEGFALCFIPGSND